MVKRFVSFAVAVAVAIAAALLYQWCFLQGVGFATALHFPSWWFDIVPRRAHGIFAWAFLCHTLAVVAVSLPFALFFSRVYGRLGIVVAFAAALAPLAPDVPWMLINYRYWSAFLRIWIWVDTLKVMLVLPTLTWLLLWLPPNSRWSGPLLDKVLGLGGRKEDSAPASPIWRWRADRST